MKLGHIFLALGALCASVVIHAGEGDLCIAPVPKATPGTKSLANATASASPYEFKVAVDGLSPVDTSHKESQVVGGLDTSKSHLVVIHQGAKRVQSFKLNFQNYKSDSLCLWFGPLYESWSVWPMAQSRGKCACRDSR